jgi:hypothetical protein
MTKWSEIRVNDRIFFKGKSGTGSVVKTERHGYYFMPAKIGMRLKGVKKPISKYEMFILNDIQVQEILMNDRTVKCLLTRASDGTQFAISEDSLMRYFGKSDQSVLGGPVL